MPRIEIFGVLSVQDVKFEVMKTNPLIEREGIDPIVKDELIEIEKRLEFLNSIKPVPDGRYYKVKKEAC